MTDAINILELVFTDVDGNPQTLGNLRGRRMLLLLLQGMDVPKFGTCVEPIRNAIAGSGLAIQPIFDPSAMPKVVWWGIRKMRGEHMRSLGPEGLPRLLVDPEGDAFRKLKCAAGHLTLLLVDEHGQVERLHQVPSTNLADISAIVQPILQIR
jgi:hypothetical protein